MAEGSQATVEELAAIGLFGGLGDHLLAALAAKLRVSHFERDDTIFREGERGREMFVVLAGTLEVFKRSRRGQQARVAMLRPGDWFGEMSLLDVMPRPATVRAHGPTRLLSLCSKDLNELYRSDQRSYALLIMNIARQLSRRLRVSQGILADTMAGSDNPGAEG